MNQPSYLKKFKIDESSDEESNQNYLQQLQLQQSKVKVDKEEKEKTKKEINPSTKEFLNSYISNTKQYQIPHEQLNKQEDYKESNIENEIFTNQQHIENSLATNIISTNFHHLQVIDEDVENFKRRMDILIKNFKTDSLTDFMNIKRNLLSEQKQIIESERQKSESIISAKNNQIENLKEALTIMKKNYEEENIKKEKLADKLYNIKRIKREKENKRKAFDLIKEQFVENRKNEKIINKFKGKILDFNLKRRLFNHIKLNKENTITERILKEKDDLCYQRINEISMKYNMEINELRKRLEESEHQIKKFKDQKYMIQENLKKTLMRNVVAMNFEAMNILEAEDLEKIGDSNKSLFNESNIMNKQYPQMKGLNDSSLVHNINVNLNDNHTISNIPNTTIPNNSAGYVYNIENYENISQSKDSNWINATQIPNRIKENMIFKSKPPGVGINYQYQSEENEGEIEDNPNNLKQEFQSTFGGGQTYQAKGYSIPYDEMKESKI